MSHTPQEQGQGAPEDGRADAAMDSPCNLSLDELLAGPGGYSTREFDGQRWVREDVYEYVSGFAFCALERLDRILIEAERRGIDREVMERVSDHRALSGAAGSTGEGAPGTKKEQP